MLTLHDMMGVEVVSEAYDIAWDYLDRIGASQIRSGPMMNCWQASWRCTIKASGTSS
jgi:hypothetical protein